MSKSEPVIRPRRTFAKIPEIKPVPNLIAVQMDSYDWFLGDGLAEVFRDISPIEDFTGNLQVEFGEHHLEKPKYDVEECKEKDMTYSAPLFVTVRFINRETGEIKEQVGLHGGLPPHERPRHLHHQRHRARGGVPAGTLSRRLLRPRDGQDSDKELFFAKIIPSRGAWLEFEIDKKDTVGVRIDRKRKQPVTVLLRALGCETDEDILALFDGARAHRQHPGEGPHHHRRGSGDGYIQEAAPGRAADRGLSQGPA